MKTGMKGGNLTALSEADLDRVYEASLSILWDPGIVSESDLLLDIFEKGGAKVDRQSRAAGTERRAGKGTGQDRKQIYAGVKKEISILPVSSGLLPIKLSIGNICPFVREVEKVNPVG